MIVQFEQLSEQEKQQLLDAIPLISILVAGADGRIDTREKAAAKKATHVRAYHEDTELLHSYYQEIDGIVEERMTSYLQLLSNNTEERTTQVVDELKKLNKVLPQLDPQYGAALYSSFCSFAKYVAEASGGILNYLTIGPKEHKVYKLPMLDPIIWEEETEEE